MLTVFEGFRVPGAPVQVYRDDANPNRFHLLTDFPRIATDARTGLPLFSYTLYSRNIAIAYASAKDGAEPETQLGHLTFTCDLSIGDDEWKAVENHLRTVLQNEMSQPSAYNQMFGLWTSSTEPQMGYADTWTTGTVKLEMLESLPDTFVKHSTDDRSPNLRGTMGAAFSVGLGTEGAQLLWQALNPGDRAETAPAGPAAGAYLDAVVTYALTGVARSPALDVTIKAEGGPVYEELRKRSTVISSRDGTTFTYPTVAELTKELIDKKVIDVRWNDLGIPPSTPDGEALKAKLSEYVFSMMSNKIVEAFFTTVPTPGLKPGDLGATFTQFVPGGVPGTALYLDKYEESYERDIGFSMKYTTNHTFTAGPQTSVLPVLEGLTADQREQLVKIVDVGSPEVRVLDVAVLTNADFEGDKIANITTTLSYRQFDHLVDDWIETSESFVFTTGKETFRFRTRLARDEQHRLIDLYDAKAVVNYIASTQQAPIELHDLSDRALTFSYDRLGYVNVLVQAGDVDWTQIASVFVDLAYDSAMGHPDAKGTVQLTRERPEARWTTSKHGQTSNAYSYTVRYVFVNGDEVTAPAAKDERGTLVVHDLLVGRITTTFDVSLDPSSVASVTLRIRRHVRPGVSEDTRHPFTESASFDYVAPLAQGASPDIQISWAVQYTDGYSEPPTPWLTLTPGQDPPRIDARRYRIPIMVDGAGVDWQRWRAAYVMVTYRDDAHRYQQPEEFRLDGTTMERTVEALAFSTAARTYDYKVTFVPKDGSDPVEVPADGTTATRTGPLLLETLV